MKYRLKVCFFLMCTLLVLSNSDCGGGGAAGVLTVAAGGIATDQVLDKLDAKVTNIIQQAAAAGSLVSTKVARDLELEVQAARQQLHDELKQNWDRLDKEEVSGLKEIDKAIDELNSNIQKAGNIEDDLSLDVDQKLNAIPFLKQSVTIRRVQGSSQYFRTEGLYVVNVKGNVFDQMADKPIVKLGDEKPCEDDPTKPAPVILDPKSVSLQPPYDLVLKIDAGVIEKYFQDRVLAYIPISICQQVKNRDYALQVWRKQYRDGKYKFSLELFPKYPAAYRLTEFDNEPFVDASQTLVQPARFMYIAGCGNSGCNAYYNVCTDVPAGAQAIQAVDFQDSFNGWGGFGRQWATSTGICAVYWQHSHNVGRNVGFNVQYHPLGSHIVPHDINLVPMSPDKQDEFSAKDIKGPQAANAVLNSFSLISSMQNAIVSASAAVKQLINNASASAQTIQASEATSTPNSQVAPAQLVAVDHGAVRFGRWYAAELSPNMDHYELDFRTFTGDELLDTNRKPSGKICSSRSPNGTRLNIRLKTPWSVDNCD